jgi:hypothetical protein
MLNTRLFVLQDFTPEAAGYHGVAYMEMVAVYCGMTLAVLLRRAQGRNGIMLHERTRWCTVCGFMVQLHVMKHFHLA